MTVSLAKGTVKHQKSFTKLYMRLPNWESIGCSPEVDSFIRKHPGKEFVVAKRVRESLDGYVGNDESFEFRIRSENGFLERYPKAVKSLVNESDCAFNGSSMKRTKIWPVVNDGSSDEDLLF